MNTSNHVEQVQHKPLLCKLGFHAWETEKYTSQSTNATGEILGWFLHNLFKSYKCTRCGKVK